jgi:transcriptional regulator with XRE-family HTH domain
MTAAYTEAVCLGNTDLAIPLIKARGYPMPMGYLDRLARLRKAKGFTQSTLAERLGVEQPTVQRWEAGKREPSLAQLFELARILEVEPGNLIGDTVAAPLGPRLFIKGTVAAGVWREALELPADDWSTFTGRAGVEVADEFRFGLRVEGDSMDEVYPEGTILECVSVFGRVEVAPGKRVIALRTDQHGMIEATVKELVESEGTYWLVPKSSNPAHRPWQLPEDNSIRIAAVVVASVRPE